MNKRIFITGISGFLGSQIAKELYDQGFELIALKRNSSDLSRCYEFSENVNWINIAENWEQKVIELNPQIIVHSAWAGVRSEERDNWKIQTNNLNLTLKLLSIAKVVNVEKFISFGSQAEYGYFSGVIDENYILDPKSAYGLSKFLCSQIIKVFCEQNKINWYWLRLFSFFGEKESSSWFIPSLIKNISENKPMDMTPGEQRYAYMYIGDLASIICCLINSSASSGIYNLSSKQSISLKDLVERIIHIIKPLKLQVNFGAIKYRDNQSMLIQGDVSKLESEIGEFIETSFDVNLKKVVEFIINSNERG
jgi:nucleoside-diphosphate-sugar epimerase